MQIFSVFGGLFIPICLASVAFYPPGNKRTVCKRGICKDYCDIPRVNLEPGDTFQDSCELTRCYEDFSASIATCGVAVNADNCLLAPDYTLNYPDCCARSCPKVANIENK